MPVYELVLCQNLAVSLTTSSNPPMDGQEALVNTAVGVSHTISMRHGNCVCARVCSQTDQWRLAKTG